MNYRTEDNKTTELEGNRFIDAIRKHRLDRRARIGSGSTKSISVKGMTSPIDDWDTPFQSIESPWDGNGSKSTPVYSNKIKWILLTTSMIEPSRHAQYGRWHHLVVILIPILIDHHFHIVIVSVRHANSGAGVGEAGVVVVDAFIVATVTIGSRCVVIRTSIVIILRWRWRWRWPFCSFDWSPKWF